MWNGPDPVLIWGRGSVCVFSQKEDGAQWLPERLVHQVDPDPECSSMIPTLMMAKNLYLARITNLVHSLHMFQRIDSHFVDSQSHLSHIGRAEFELD